MNYLGACAELESDNPLLPSIRDLIDPGMPDRDRRLVSFYLLQGGVLRYVMERVPDVLDGEEVHLTAGLRTDGDWYWRADLAHYVAKYGLALPPAFVAQAAANGWVPPILTEEERGALAAALRNEGTGP